jgi:hypothetical protein
MALSRLEQDTVSHGFAAAKLALDQLYPALHELNVIYDSGGGAKTTIDQPGLDAIASFSGLTKTQLDDGMFALTSTLKTAIDNAYTQLAQLAARA